MIYRDDRVGRARWRPRRRPFVFSALGYLITINVVIFLFQSAGFLWERRALQGTIEMMQFGSFARSDLTQNFEWWRLFTYMFVHQVPAPLHVGLNMLMIFICGRIVQLALGPRALVQIYLLGGLLGALAHAVLSPYPVIGASAAAYAMLVAMGMIVPEQKILVLLGLVVPVRMRVKYLVVGMVAVTVVFLIIDLVAGPDAQIPMISNVGHLAHLGGALAGFLYCRALGVGRSLTLADLQERRRRIEHGLPAAGGGSRSGMVGPEPEAFSMAEVDAILEKIARDGFLSLTQDERDTLQRGLRQMSRT